MAQIPESVIEEILTKADIESVVGKYVAFTKRTGSNLFGICPFHSEKTPSFSVSINKGIYHCFGCGKGGNAISFIKEIERLSYPEAIRFLGAQYGVDVPDTYEGRTNDDLKAKKDRVYKLLNEAGKFYFQCLSLPSSASCKAYIKKRSLSTDTVRKFGIGYAPDGWDTLYKHLLSKGFTDDEMKDSGLFTVSKKTGKLIDLFRGRMMFPIFNSFGKLIAFGGRTLGDDLPKYVNSPDSLVYKKQEHLYALNYAKQSKNRQLIIVEGYMDAIAMHQAGVDNAVASLGTAFTEAQIRLASKYAEDIIFFFDADKAGQAAAIRAIDRMLKYLKKMTGLKMRIRIAVVPDKKDPDEYIRNNGAEKFIEVVKHARDVDVYLADRAYDDNYSDDSGLDFHKYQEDIITYGSWIFDDIKREKMAASASVHLGCNFQTVLNRMIDAEKKLERDQAKIDERSSKRDSETEIYERTINAVQENIDDTASEPSREEAVPDGSDRAYKQELELFIYAVRLKEKLCNPKVVSKEDVIRPGDFIGSNMKAIVEYFLNNFDANSGVQERLLINELSKYVLNGMPAEEVYLKMCEDIKEVDGDVLRDLYLASLYRLRINYLTRYQQSLIRRMASASPEEREVLSDKLQRVVYMKNKLVEKESRL